MKGQSLCVTAFPRIHVGLLDLAAVSRRVYGGSGFSISCFPAVVQANPDKKLSVQFECSVEPRTSKTISSVIENLRSFHPSIMGAVKIVSCPPEHVGLGSKTTLLLSVLKALDLINGFNISPTALAEISGRGGASGIGIHGFFQGGFIVDAGHPREDVAAFGPSSAVISKKIPMLVMRIGFPQNWIVHLVLPKGPSISGEKEIEFFAENTPVPAAEVLEVFAAVYHGIVPGILAKDMNLFARALDDMHATGFKQRELMLQPESAALRAVLRNKLMLPIGMSSMGPMLYVVGNSDDYALAGVIEQLAQTSGAEYLGRFAAINHPFSVTYDN